MKNSRKLVLIAAVFFVIAAVGLVRALNVLLAENRDQVRQELQKVIGKDVSFASLEVVWLGRPGFVAKEFRIADDPRFAATPLVWAQELILGISLWNLLFRRLVIDRLAFVAPELQIIINETGSVNVATLLQHKNELRDFPTLPPEAPERRRAGVSFSIDRIDIKEGRIDYIDRATKEPSELGINHLRLTLAGFEPSEVLKVRLTASLTEGLSQDMRIEGRLDPAPRGQPWSRRNLDLNLQFDSLYAPVVAQAIASVRNKIPNELDVTGPMALNAVLRGTPQRPRIDDITLKVPLFGSSKYNAVVTAAVAFSDQRSWDDAWVQGKLVMEPLALSRLRTLKSFASILPDDLATDGTIGAYAAFEGTWENLRIGALVRADKADLRYKALFRKPVDMAAEIRARIYREKNRLRFEHSEFLLGANRFDFSGAIVYGDGPRLELKLVGNQEPIAPWSELFAPSGVALGTGKAGWNVSLVKRLLGDDGTWSMQGEVTVTGAELRQTDGDRSIDRLNAKVSFAGKQARFDRVSFRIGQSQFFLDGIAQNIENRRASYSLKSPQIILNQLPFLTASPPAQLQQVSSNGELQFRDSGIMLTGSISAAEANLYQFQLKNLRSEIAVTPLAFTFKNLSAQMLNGVVESSGYWSPTTERLQQFDFSSKAEGIKVGALLAQLPAIPDRFDGVLDGQGRFTASAAEGASIKDSLNGSGEALLRAGVIKDFNPIAELLSRGSGSSPSGLPASLAALVGRPDTPFDSIKASFTVKQQRISTENLVMTTPDYTITGAGWVGFDLSTSWNGVMLISPRLTEEIQRDYRLIRYLLDRRGRLAVSFHLNGKIPNLRVGLDNRGLAEALRTGKNEDKNTDQKRQQPKQNKRWLPDALERFLNR